MKMPPKRRKTYGKSLRRIAKKLGVRFVKTKDRTCPLPKEGD